MPAYPRAFAPCRHHDVPEWATGPPRHRPFRLDGHAAGHDIVPSLTVSGKCTSRRFLPGNSERYERRWGVIDVAWTDPSRRWIPPVGRRSTGCSGRISGGALVFRGSLSTSGTTGRSFDGTIQDTEMTRKSARSLRSNFGPAGTTFAPHQTYRRIMRSGT